MKNIPKHSGFTLVEVLVAMTVFAMTMVSVMLIYAAASQIALKTDINREMQQNIKSVIETIAEDVRKSEDGIAGVSDTVNVYTILNGSGSAIEIGDNRYMLLGMDEIRAHYDSGLVDPLNRIVDSTIGCKDDFTKVCVIAKMDLSGNLIGPLSNSKISFTNLEFYVTNGPVPKVTINLTMRPAIKNGLRADLIQNSELHFQTTISERHLQIK